MIGLNESNFRDKLLCPYNNSTVLKEDKRGPAQQLCYP